MTKRGSQSDHDTMVKCLATALEEMGRAEVRAHLLGWETPLRMEWESGKGHIPDVTCQADQFHIYEVETADSIDDEHTEDQWQLFAAYADKEDAIFTVVVPEGSEGMAEQRLDELGIQAEVLEV